MIRVIKAVTSEEYRAGAILFKEYADSLDFTLSFQSFEDELNILPKMYGQPTGALLLAKSNGEYIGAVGLRQIENETTCEVKRMYIRPGYQGKGIGKMLMETLLEEAKMMHYQTVKLDTLGPKMPAAVGLYQSFGFKETTPYNYNPYEGVLYFEKQI